MEFVKQIKRWGLLILLMSLLGLFFYFRLYRHLSFENLQAHRVFLLNWTQDNFALAILCFMGFYIIAIACSIPVASFLTLLAGFLFGPLIGTLSVVISATIGAFILFMAVQLAVLDWVRKKASKKIKMLEVGFQKNAFSYLLFLRLLPLFPFWLINIVPALLGVSKRVFITATAIGIIPGTFIYVMTGNGLGHVLDSGEKPELGIIFNLHILLPLIGLAVLSLLPILYKTLKKN